MGFLDEIRKAVESNQPLSVTYHGGSQPGKVRTITPLSIEGDQVRARCHVSGKSKVFVIAKLAPALAGPEFSRAPPPPQFQKVSEVATFYRDTLEGMGWVVDVSGEQLTLTRRYKNGRPLKHPAVTLSYSPTVTNSYFDLDLNEVIEEHEAANKFTVFAKSGYGARLKTADKAAAKFMELAESELR